MQIYAEQYDVHKASEQCRIFGSISSISLHQIEYDKIHTKYSKELENSYTMRPIPIFIDKYWGGGGGKLKKTEILTFFPNIVIKKLHMKKKLNGMKYWRLYLLRQKNCNFQTL